MTALQSWPDHFLTLDEWDALELDERFRYELVEGVLTMMIGPRSRHQKVQLNLAYRVEEQLPDELTVQHDMDVVVTRSPLTVRIPDMIVVRTALDETNPARFDAADVLLATEILSQGTRAVGRIHKFGEYAEAGIPRYWILDIDGPVTLRAFVLVDGTYELTGEHAGVAVLDVAGHPVRLDLDALTRR